MMECFYCGAELDCYDYYKQYGKKIGDIYKCPNHEGFESKQEVSDYLETDEDGLTDYLSENDLDSWEDVLCESSVHSVSGSFYTDAQGNLYAGYPC